MKAVISTSSKKATENVMWHHAMVCPYFSSTVAHRYPTEKKPEALSFLGGLGVGGVGAEEEGTSQSMQQHLIREES